MGEKKKVDDRKEPNIKKHKTSRRCRYRNHVINIINTTCNRRKKEQKKRIV